MENIDIDKDNLKNIDISIAILVENIDIDIDKGILQNIDIDRILYRLGFGISNTCTRLLSDQGNTSLPMADTSESDQMVSKSKMNLF